MLTPLFLQQNLRWIIPLIIIDLVLKGIALWRAGRNNHSVWFVFLFIINSIGILPAIYLLFVDVRSNKKKKSASTSSQ